MSKNNKERRRKRYERNVSAEKEYKDRVWSEGGLIEPNHNGGYYPAEICAEYGRRLLELVKRSGVRDYRIKIRDYIIYYNPDIDKTPEYEELKSLLESYWDDRS